MEEEFSLTVGKVEDTHLAEYINNNKGKNENKHNDNENKDNYQDNYENEDDYEDEDSHENEDDHEDGNCEDEDKVEYHEDSDTEEYLSKRKRQLNQYDCDLRYHEIYTAPEINDSIIKREFKEFESSIIGLTTWSVSEKAAFFHALERVGRDPQAISTRVKTKSLALCGAYLELLSEESKNTPTEKSKVHAGKHRAHVLEASRDWEEFEEKMAAELLAKEARSYKHYIDHRNVKFRRKKYGHHLKRRRVDKLTFLKSRSFFQEDRLKMEIAKMGLVPKLLPLAVVLDLYLIIKAWLMEQIKEVINVARAERLKDIGRLSINHIFRRRAMGVIITADGLDGRSMRKRWEKEAQEGGSDDVMMGDDYCDYYGDNEIEMDKESRSDEESENGEQNEEKDIDKEELERFSAVDLIHAHGDDYGDNEIEMDKESRSDEESEDGEQNEEKDIDKEELERFSAVDLIHAHEVCSLLNWKSFPPPSEDLLEDAIDSSEEYLELDDEYVIDIVDRHKDVNHDNSLWKHIEETPRPYSRMFPKAF